MAPITLKFKHGKEMRRLTVEQPLTYAFVTQLMSQLFPDVPNYTLKYEDPDGDKITVSSQGEIQEAVSVALGSNNVLRFIVSEKSSETKQPENPSTPLPSQSVAAPSIVATNPEPAPATSTTASPAQNVPAIHLGITCDGCQVSPITGVRYKCFVCSDFDLCANCEATKTHDPSHPFIQIPQPQAFRGRGFGCPGRRGGRFHGAEGGVVAPPMGMPFHPHLHHPRHHFGMHHPTINVPEGVPAVNPSPIVTPVVPSIPMAPPTFCARRGGRGRGLARFVQDVTIEDGTVLKPNEPFLKVWRIRNSGETAWPNGTVLMFVGGDLLGAPAQVVVPRTVNAGEEIDISVNMVAPEKSGRYTGYWRLMSPEGRFGQRVWVDIFVNSEKPNNNNEQQQQQQQQTSIADLDEVPAGVSLDPSFTPVPITNDNDNINSNVNVAVPIVSFPVQPSVPLAVPVPIPVPSPFVQAPIAPPPELLTEDEVKSLSLLRDMGFSGSLLELLRKNNGDLMSTIRNLLGQN